MCIRDRQAVATGIKRTHPDKFVFTYQGDGDLSSIGMAEIVHAAARGEKISTIFVNNGIYGMTGGQMAPTTLIGQKATTAQNGRDPEINGFPIRVSEMLATLTGAVFVERVSVDTPANVRKAKKAIKKAFQVQQAGLGFGIVEVLDVYKRQIYGKSSYGYERISRHINNTKSSAK